MTDYIYLDNSNIYIEGCRIEAVKQKYEENIYEAMVNGTVDHSWKMDYGKLYGFFCPNPKSVARLWGSPPPGDSFWEMVERKGWQHTIFDRNIRGKEKKVDVAIAHAITKDAYRLGPKGHVYTLVAGDSDYVPVVKDLVSEGYEVEVAFWSHAAKELKDSASKFINLDPYHEHISLR